MQEGRGAGRLLALVFFVFALVDLAWWIVNARFDGNPSFVDIATYGLQIVPSVAGVLFPAALLARHPDAVSRARVLLAGTVLFALGVHSLIFIYFLGTGRWVKEVALAYGIADAPLPKLTRDLKRRTFPPALIAMLVPIATAAAGAAVQWRDLNWTVHLSLGLATLAVNVWAFWVEYRNVSINVDVIEEVLREVDRIRASHGLPSNAEALRQEQA